MAIPITNLKISDITLALGESNSNVGNYKTHLSPKVQAIGLDPTYCPGDNIQQRLANLRSNPLAVGKFRNYEEMSLSYRCGYLYSYGAVDVYYPLTVHVPDGWRIPSVNDYFWLFKSIDPDFQFGTGNNVLSPSFRSTISNLDIENFITYYQSRTGEVLIDPSLPKPGYGTDVIGLDLYGFKMIPAGRGDIDDEDLTINWGNVGVFSSLWCRCQAYEQNSIIFTISSDFSNSIQADVTSRLTLLPIRLMKNDSVDPGYLEDIDGNIYPTVKINNVVMTAENIRTTTASNGLPMIEVFDGGIMSSVTEPAFLRTDILDIF